MNQPKKQTNYWFKRRRYGYGWIPTSRQGWIVVALYVAVVLSGFFLLQDAPRNAFTKEVGVYVAAVTAATLVLLVVG